MLSWSRVLVRAIGFVLSFGLIPSLQASPAVSWSGVVRDSAGNPVDKATITIVVKEGSREYSGTTSMGGQFRFLDIAAGDYVLTVSAAGTIWTAAAPVVVKEGATLTAGLQLSAQGQEVHILVTQD